MSRAGRLLTTVLRSSAPSGIDVTTFTQTLGAELLTNGNFAAWTAGNPDGWTVTTEDANRAISEVGAGEGHGGAGTGYCNIYRNPPGDIITAYQDVLTVGSIYECSITVNKATAGYGKLGATDGSIYLDFNGARPYTVIGRSKSTRFIMADAGATVDITVDDVTVKRVTLNAQRVSKADGTFEFQFALPASPKTQDAIHLLYRIEAVGDELYDCWDAYLFRNAGNTAWSYRLDVISSGTRTNKVVVADVGNPTLLKVATNGNSHDAYTGTGTIDAATYTQRGSTISDATFATSTGLNTVYTSGFTPTRLKAP